MASQKEIEAAAAAIVAVMKHEPYAGRHVIARAAREAAECVRDKPLYCTGMPVSGWGRRDGEHA